MFTSQHCIQLSLREIHFFARSGRAGQPGPRAENRERGERETRWNAFTVNNQVKSMTEIKPRVRDKMQLAIAIAQGSTASAWARANDVPRQTAWRWSKEPDVRARGR